MTTWLANRNSNLSSFNAVAINYSTLTGSTLTNTSAINVSSVNVSSINTLTINTLTINTSLVNTSTLNTRLLLTSTIQVNSSMISLGSSTNQVYTNMSQGNFSSSTKWVSSLYNLTSTNNVSMSANSQYQLALSPSTNTTALQITSTFGQSWTTLTGATGLPIATSYTAGAISGNGQYAALGAYGSYMYTTANSGQTWTNTNPNTPSIYLPFEIAPVNGSIGGTTLTVTGSPALVPGIVGSKAVNFVNASPGTGTAATQFLTGTWTVPSNFTVSFWFNPQSATGSQYIFFVNGTMTIQLGGFGAIQYYTSTGINISTTYPVVVNTWYNVTAIYQASGVCSLYVNNALIGIQTSNAAITASSFILGQRGDGYAFNGYIDDVKIYNSAITFTPMVPQNWSNVAISNTGQYMLATATGSGLFMSSNYGSTWSQVTGAMLNAIWSAAQVSATGQYMLANSPVVNVQPQLTGLSSSGTALTTSSWQTSGITWIASASSVLAANPLTSLFDNVTTASWANSLQVYTNGGNSASFTTNIIGVTQTPYSTGDWVQIQSSVPLVMYSYQLANGLAISQTPNIFYIAGSTDGITWYPIQRAEITGGGTTGTGSSYTLIPGIIGVNSTAAQTFGSITLTGTTYATTTNAYTYFRFICTSIFSSSSTYVAFSEWYINFQAGGQTYSTNYGSTWNNGYTIPSNVLSLAPSGQYALAANCPQLIAELNFEGASPAAYQDIIGLGYLTYINNQGGNVSIVMHAKVGTQSLYFTNTAGSASVSYANYALSSFFNGAPAYTISTWIYPTALPASSESVPYVLTDNSYIICGYPSISTAGILNFYFYTTTSGTNVKSITTTTTISTNIWSHIVIVFAYGIAYLYANGIQIGTTTYTGTVSLRNNVGAPTTLLVGAGGAAYGGYAGYVDDLRIYSTALSLSQVNTLYNNGASVVQASTILVPTIYPVSTLQGFSAALPTASTLTLGSTALNASTNLPIASACSSSGQYMVFVTNNTTGNNVYYSSNYGSTFTGFQIGSALTSCAISYDGSYITISNATNVWTLNNNSNGFSLAIGNQAGYQNQAVNAIAIGNYAGYQNQTANSIILNASGQGPLGTGLNAVANGFYVAPIASYTASSSSTFSLLGYGTGTTADNQVVQLGNVSMSGNLLTINNAMYITGTITATGFSGSSLAVYGPTLSTATSDNIFLNVNAADSFNGNGGINVYSNSINLKAGDLIWGGPTRSYGAQIYIGGGFSAAGAVSHAPIIMSTAGAERMRIANTGNVGIGTTNPSVNFQVWGSSQFSNSVYIGVNSFYIGTSSNANQALNLQYQAIIYAYDITNTGYMRIFNPGTSAAGSALRFDNNQNGNATIISTGTNGIVSVSDIRRKKDISPMDSCLCKLLALEPVNYHYIMKDGSCGPEEFQHGFIAQQAQTVFPELVQNDIWSDNAPDGTPYLLMKNNMNAYFVKAFQEHNTLILQQATQITTHQQEITALQSIVAAQSTQVLQSQVTAQQIQIAQLMSQIQTLTERLAAANIPLTTPSTQ